jgi:pilus assembly protein Flp/PilA
MSERTSTAAGLSPAASAAFGILRRFRDDESGATAIEYAMIGGLMFVAIAGSLRLYGSRMSVIYGNISSTIAAAN